MVLSAMTLSAADQLKLSDFDFDLPEALIAQEPAAQRDQSRLLALRRSVDGMEHRIFSDIEHYLMPGDLLIVNDTKVFPCRLSAQKPGGGKAEIFLLSEKSPNLWDALVKGGAAAGKRLSIAANISAEVTGEGPDGIRTIRFHGIDDIRQVLADLAKTPLPPYIKREPSDVDRDRYQTVYAAKEGAVAAPTAGLHFTPELLGKIKAKGVQVAAVTLHVGPGTFQPVRVDVITRHRMLGEHYTITAPVAGTINNARAEGRRVIAVGTTSVRTIETAAREDGTVIAGTGSSELFIYPGYRFKVIDGIITNFHLPKSTLLMLVSAFAGRERILSAYRTAVEEKYRFYSYGDAMAIL